MLDAQVQVAEPDLVLPGVVPEAQLGEIALIQQSNTIAIYSSTTNTTFWMPTHVDTENQIILPPTNITPIRYNHTAENGQWIEINATTGTSTTNIIRVINNATTTGEAYLSSNGTWVTWNNVNVIIQNNHVDVAVIARQEKQRQRSHAQRIHRAKGAIKRALKLHENMGFGEDVRMFIKGDEIELYHPESIFKFVLHRKSHDHYGLIEQTHSPIRSVPYHLHLYTKDDVHVADLCVYLKDTPILDQVLAVAMYIRSGNEEDVLEKANWFNRTSSEEVRELVHQYNPNYGRKLGYKISNSDRGVFYNDIPAGIIVANTYGTERAAHIYT